MAHAKRSVNKRLNWFTIAMISIAFALFLAGSNRVPVPTVDGAIRAVEARTIVETGKWFPIQYQGQHVADHPPLYVWLSAISFKIFGVNDFAANFPARLAAFLTVILIGFIAVEVGFEGYVGLLAVLILCTTRDFVLSSVRGYIEPLMELFIYAGVWFSVFQWRSKKVWPAIGAGVCLWFAFFSKGPPALWPFLFLGFLFLWSAESGKRRLHIIAAYLGAFAACTAFWALWNQTFDYWPYWREYWNAQVLSSAVEGRGGAQGHDPFYFVSILLKFYWPWLPFLVWATWRSISLFWKFTFTDEAIYSWVFGVLSLGFVVGFSMVKWKFWYYIAPAYPALALFIAVSLHEKLERASKVDPRSYLPKVLFNAGLVWSIVVSVFPVALHHERVPEVQAFKSTILNSDVQGSVWLMNDELDHNKIGTSGEWYFHRQVLKVENEEAWTQNQLKAPAWIIAKDGTFASCSKAWCQKSIRVLSNSGSELLLYRK